MKKIILSLALLFILSGIGKSQGLTFTITSSKITLSSVLDSIYRTSYTSMGSAVQYYTWTIACAVDSSVSCSRNSSGTYSWIGIDKTGDKFQFESSGGKNPDIWIWSTNGGSFSITVRFIKLIW